MTGLWIALIVGGVALVVLVAVAAAAVSGPLRSLLRSAEAFEEVDDELERLRRNVDVVRSRADEIARRARGGDPEGP